MQAAGATATEIYAVGAPDGSPGQDRLQELAGRISRTEPELPLIHAPLANEKRLTLADTETRAAAAEPEGWTADGPVSESQWRRPTATASSTIARFRFARKRAGSRVRLLCNRSVVQRRRPSTASLQARSRCRRVPNPVLPQ